MEAIKKKPITKLPPLKNSADDGRPLRVAKRVQANILKGGKPNVAGAMKAEGYPASSIRSSAISRRKAYRLSMSEFLEKLNHLRDRTLEQAVKKLKKASYNDATMGLERITKVSQLLQGKATEILGASRVSRMTDEELLQLVEGKAKNDEGAEKNNEG